MKRFMRAATAALVTCSGVAAFGAATVAVAPIAAANAPGNPGTPSAPTVLYTENFENGLAPGDVVTLPNYTGAAPTNETYTADPTWLDTTQCNGLIVSGQSTSADMSAAGCTNTSGQASLQGLTNALGALNGAADPTSNHAVAEYTSSTSTTANGVEFQTNSPVTVSVPSGGRFLSMGLDVGEIACANYAHPQLMFSLIDGGTEKSLSASPTDPCAGISDDAAHAEHVFADGSLLTSSDSFGLMVRNETTTSAGDDHAIDNVRLLDVTPQLDASFSPASVAENANSTLTYTITNTSDLAEKDGWSFTNALPAGLVYTGGATTTCTSGGNPASVSVGGGNVSLTADLTAGQASCTVSVPVRAPGSGTYTDPGSSDYTLNGLDAPADASLTVSAPTASPSCGFGTTGTAPSSFCWFSFPNYDETAAESANGQPMTITLPNNAGTVSFTLKNAVDNANPTEGIGAVHAVSAPSYGGAQFGNGIYQGVPGSPALYQYVAGSHDTLTMSNIVVKDAAGNVVSGYRMAMADAESTGVSEYMNFTSDQANLTQVVQPGNPAVCNNATSGLGTGQVTCPGGGVSQGNALVLTSENAQNISIEQQGSGIEAAVFGIQMASVQGQVTMANRANASDSFSTSVTGPANTTVAGPSSTGAAPTNSAATNAYAFPIDGSNPGTYIIKRVADPGTNLASYVTTWACTNGGSNYANFTTAPDGSSVSVTPGIGDTIECTATETFTDSFHEVAGQSTQINTPVTSPVGSLAGDNGASPLDPLSTTVTSQGSNGTVSIDPTSGAVTYSPNPGFAGSDSYVINVCDKGVPEQCGDVKIPVIVSNVVANPDSATTTVGTPVNTDVRANDTTSSGTTLQTPTVATQPNNGTASVNPDGTIKYTPAAGFSGVDSYTYQVCDSATPTQSCAIGKVTVTVDNVFTPGTASTSGVTTPQNQSVTTPLSSIASTSGEPLDPTNVAQQTAPTHGTLSIDPTTGAVKYTPDAGYSGPDSYVVTVCDTSNPEQCSNVTVPVTVEKNTVTANDDTDSTTVGTPVTTDVESNDTSASGQPLADPTVESQPSNGSAVVSGNKIAYTPNAGFSGADSYTYQVCDTSTPTPVCSTAKVTVTVNNVFTPGTASTGGVTTPQNQSVITSLSDIASTSGEPLDPTKVTQQTAPSHGTLSIDPSTGAVTYTPTPGYSGPDSYVVNVCDTSSPVQCSDVTVPVTVGVNTVTANDDTASVNTGSSASTDVRANDTSTSGQALADPTVTTQPANGTATVNPDGTIKYTPNAGFSGADSYGYQVCDTSTPTPVCSTATVNVTVNNVFTPGPGVTVGQNKSVTTPLSGVVTVNGMPLDPTMVTQVKAPKHGTISISPTTGAVTYTPVKGYSGSDSYQVQVCDTSSPVQCKTITVPVTVTPDKVIGATSQKATVKSGGSVTINPLAGLHTSSGQSLGKAFISRQGAHGHAKVNPNGTITYTPAAGFVGTDHFSYTVCDTGSPRACITRTVTVTVKGAQVVVPSLPDTGGPNQWWLEVAAGLVLAGGVLLLGRRRRA